MAEKVKRILKVAGGEKIVEWDKYFGIGFYGGILSLVAGILILIFPTLITTIVAIYLIFRGFIEVLKYSKQKTMDLIKR